MFPIFSSEFCRYVDVPLESLSDSFYWRRIKEQNKKEKTLHPMQERPLLKDWQLQAVQNGTALRGNSNHRVGLGQVIYCCGEETHPMWSNDQVGRSAWEREFAFCKCVWTYRTAGFKGRKANMSEAFWEQEFRNGTSLTRQWSILPCCSFDIGRTAAFGNAALKRRSEIGRHKIQDSL